MSPEHFSVQSFSPPLSYDCQWFYFLLVRGRTTPVFFFGSDASCSYFRAGTSGPKHEAFGAEVDRGQWLIPPESLKRDGMGKQQEDVLYVGEQKEKHT